MNHSRPITMGDRWRDGREIDPNSKPIEQRRPLVAKRLGGLVFVRGKHQGQLVVDAPEDYVKWLINEAKFISVSEKKLLRESLNQGEQGKGTK